MSLRPMVWERQTKFIGDDWQLSLSASTLLASSTIVIPGNTYLVDGVFTVCPVGITTVSAWAISLGNNPVISLVYNLTGWTPGGNLILPLGAPPISLVGMYDTSQLGTGIFTLTVPRDVTAILTPDEEEYRIQITLTDVYDTQSTVLIVPLCVCAA